MRMDVAVREDLIDASDCAKMIQALGDNNRNIKLHAAERPPRYRAKKKGRK